MFAPQTGSCETRRLCMQWAGESFGFLTSRGMAAWVIAGGAAYVFFVVPKQREEREAMVR